MIIGLTGWYLFMLFPPPSCLLSPHCFLLSPGCCYHYQDRSPTVRPPGALSSPPHSLRRTGDGVAVRGTLWHPGKSSPALQHTECWPCWLRLLPSAAASRCVSVANTDIPVKSSPITSITPGANYHRAQLTLPSSQQWRDNWRPKILCEIDKVVTLQHPITTSWISWSSQPPVATNHTFLCI